MKGTLSEKSKDFLDKAALDFSKEKSKATLKEQISFNLANEKQSFWLGTLSEKSKDFLDKATLKTVQKFISDFNKNLKNIFLL